MSKKILGICTALMALAALAIPPAASAVPTLRESGTPLAVGAKVKAVGGEHSVFETGGVGITCSENWMTGEVHTNSDSEGIEGTITAASFKGSETETKCNGSTLLGPTRVKIPALEGGGDWCIKNIAGADEFEVLGRSCTEAGSGVLTFTLEGSLLCIYKREASVKGTFTTGSAPATLKVTGEPTFTKEGGSFLCPGSGKITKMAFDLYTEDETTGVSIDEVTGTTLRDNEAPLKVGAKFKATQDEPIVFEGGGVPITCSEAWMTGEVHANDYTNGITGTITDASLTGAEAGTRCDGGSLLGATTVLIPALTNEGGTGHWCIQNLPGLDEFELSGRGCTESGNGTLTFIFVGSLTCRYKREVGVRGSFITGSAPATLKVTSEQELAKHSGSFLCPPNIKIKAMAFNLYTDNEAETPVSIERT